MPQFLAEPPTDNLAQGDVCVEVPVPIVVDGTKCILRTGGDQPLAQGLAEAFAKGPPLFFAIQAVFCPVVVLTQTCDLEDLEHGADGRLVIAPIHPEEDSPMFAKLEASIASNLSGDRLAKAIASKAGADKAVKQAMESTEKQRRERLDDLWGNGAIGAFPIAEIANGPVVAIPRSICHFDNAVSVPKVYLPFLRQKRVRRMTPHWLALLQEALRNWQGRFAFPGTKKDRLRDGLAKDMDQQAVAPAAAPSPPATAPQPPASPPAEPQAMKGSTGQSG